MDQTDWMLTEQSSFVVCYTQEYKTAQWSTYSLLKRAPCQCAGFLSVDAMSRDCHQMTLGCHDVTQQCQMPVVYIGSIERDHMVHLTLDCFPHSFNAQTLHRQHNAINTSWSLLLTKDTHTTLQTEVASLSIWQHRFLLCQNETDSVNAWHRQYLIKKQQLKQQCQWNFVASCSAMYC